MAEAVVEAAVVTMVATGAEVVVVEVVMVVATRMVATSTMTSLVITTREATITTGAGAVEVAVDILTTTITMAHLFEAVMAHQMLGWHLRYLMILVVHSGWDIRVLPG